MLFSYNKLKELISADSTMTVQKIVQAMNSIGFEVEGYSIFADVEGIKFGKVLSTSKNPNADKLTVCEIEFSDKTRTIQTTATNVKAKDIVIAFVPGSRVDKTVFGEKEMKGVKSEGMLSSLAEFGIDEKLVRQTHIDGITIYNDVKDISIDPIKYLGLFDYIIDVSILTNRADANSYFVMATELAAYFHTKAPTLKTTTPKIENKVLVKKGKANELVTVEVKNDFKVSIHDELLLAKSGIKSINNAIDLTNMIFIMSGQPTHVYAKDKIGKQIEAKYYSGKFTALGAKEIELKNTLTIVSGKEPISLGGVIGSSAHGPDEDTTDLVIEFGQFNPKDVRESMRTAKLDTQSGSQSVKESNKGRIKLAFDYLTTYAKTFSKPSEDLKTKSIVINYSFDEVEKISGVDIKNSKQWKDVEKSMTTLGFQFQVNKIKVPDYRYDVIESCDINEEILRFYGYDNIEPKKPTAKFFKFSTNVGKELLHSVHNLGYQQITTYSLLSKTKNKFNPFKTAEDIDLLTFVSKERETYRKSMMSAFIDVIDYHTKRGFNNLSFFEIGKISGNHNVLGLVNNSFEKIKKDLFNLFPNIELRRTDESILHKGVSADIFFKNDYVGYIGKFHPAHFDTNLFMAEILIAPFANNPFKIQEYDQAPIKFIDVTLNTTHKEDIKEVISKFKGLALSINFIDDFKKEDGSLNTTYRIECTEANLIKLKEVADGL